MNQLIMMIREGDIEIRDCPIHGKPYKAMFSKKLAKVFGNEDSGYRAVGYISCLELFRDFKDMK